MRDSPQENECSHGASGDGDGETRKMKAIACGGTGAKAWTSSTQTCSLSEGVSEKVGGWMIDD